MVVIRKKERKEEKGETPPRRKEKKESQTKPNKTYLVLVDDQGVILLVGAGVQALWRVGCEGWKQRGGRVSNATRRKGMVFFFFFAPCPAAFDADDDDGVEKGRNPYSSTTSFLASLSYLFLHQRADIDVLEACGVCDQGGGRGLARACERKSFRVQFIGLVFFFFFIFDDGGRRTNDGNGARPSLRLLSHPMHFPLLQQARTWSARHEDVWSGARGAFWWRGGGHKCRSLNRAKRESERWPKENEEEGLVALLCLFLFRGQRAHPPPPPPPPTPPPPPPPRRRIGVLLLIRCSLFTSDIQIQFWKNWLSLAG